MPEAPTLPSVFAEWSVPENGYASNGQLKEMDVILSRDGAEQGRDFSMEYDELGRTIWSSIASDEWGMVRDFTYTYDIPRGRHTRTGPDGVETLMEFDRANRLILLRRGPEASPLIDLQYEYYDNGLLYRVKRGLTFHTVYSYDAANQVTGIDHQSVQGRLPYLIYTYNARGLPETVTEFNHLRRELAETTFTYDNLGRLIHEVRYDVVQGQDVYDLSYEYDPGGNRTRKIDAVNEIQVQYHYDLEDPAAYASANNRLMYYETFETSGGGQVLESTTYYFYNSSGNVTRVVTNQEGSNQYEATFLKYARNESAVSFVLGERWDWDGDPQHDPTGYYIAYAREFRYDGARQRYLNRELDPNELRDNDLLVRLNDIWSDYDGDEIYGDFTIEDSTVTVTRSFEPGVGRVDDPFGVFPKTEYYHADLIGTTRDVSYMGHSRGPAVYTAFGELIDGTNHRYGYAGAWGYQTHGDFPFLHVGARYYDPATGRFLQRDPIGVSDEANVYAYVVSAPTFAADPTGAGPDYGFISELIKQYGPKFAGRIAKRIGVAGACFSAWETGGWLGDKIVDYTPIEDWLGEVLKVYPGERRRWCEWVLDQYRSGKLVPCFTGDTPVHTLDGVTRIDSLTRGSQVYSYDSASGLTNLGCVEFVRAQWAYAIVHIVIPGDQIDCTERHPFWDPVSHKWVAAAHLLPGDKLLTHLGKVVEVVDVVRESLDAPVQVYDVGVNGSNTFFVGATGILVHNKD